MSKGSSEIKPIDLPVYRYWQALYRSFYSRRLYVDVGKRWKGIGLLYLLLVIALCSIPFAVRMGVYLHTAFKEQITGPLANMPVFYIQNGEVVFDKPMPYLVKNDNNQVVVIIDTTGKVADFTGEYPYLSILITKNALSFKIPSPQLFTMRGVPPKKSAPVVQTFSKNTNLAFDGKKFVEESGVSNMKIASQLMIYPLVMAIFFSMFLVFFMVLGFLGQLFSTVFFSFKIELVKSIRMLIVAGTPMLLFLFILLSFNLIFPGSGIVLFFLLIAYYCFAIFSLKAESQQLVIT